MAKRVLIIATDGFEYSELTEPKKAMEEAGHEVTVASIETGTIRGWKGSDWHGTADVDMTLADVDTGDYDALIIPGGLINPDKLRVEDRAIEIIHEFDAAGKPIAAICHGPWLLAEADILDDVTVTSYESIRTDLENAGADVIDDEAVMDGNIITSRTPEDLPAFNRTILEALKDD